MHRVVDTHAHLDHEGFSADVADVVERALAAGVARIVTLGADVRSSEAAIELAERFAEVYAAVGIHPHDARSATEAGYDRLRDLARHPKVVAIGEIGLDYRYDFSSPQAQAAAFQRQLALARELALPVIVHNREADSDVIEALAATATGGPLSGVLHAFSGEPQMASRALEMGLYLGVGGMLTFKNAERTRSVVRGVALDRLLVETDSPYLAPVPHRGRRNEPAYVPLVVERLAALRGLSFAEVADATTVNACRLFGGLGLREPVDEKVKDR